MITLFYSRVCHLILGAGALQQAETGLKTINTTHLSLAAQCLAFIRSQFPAILNTLPQHSNNNNSISSPSSASSISSSSLSASALTAALDSLATDFQTHESQLLNKLECIMIELSEGAANKFLSFLTQESKEFQYVNNNLDGDSLNYDSDSNNDRLIDMSIKTLMQQTKSLNSSLSQILPLSQRQVIFRHLSQSYTKVLINQTAKLEIQKNQQIQQKAAINITFFIKQSQGENRQTHKQASYLCYDHCYH